jgi:zinc/manganese transport system ATP-binding protein
VLDETSRTPAVRRPVALAATPAQPVAQRRAVLQTRGAALAYGSRPIWAGLDIDVFAGELIAVLGPNGAGKSSLLKVVLGRQPLTKGNIWVAGKRPGRGDRRIGLVPQHASPSLGAVRARDAVRLGLEGHRWGPWRPRREVHRRVDDLLAAVGASAYADAPMRLLSGGEQQRVRVAQALAGEQELLLCDEPLASLDLHHQHAVSRLIDSQRRARNAAVLFVTHEINPVLPFVDRVLYLAPGGHRIGTPAEVLCSECLSDLHGAPVEVIHSQHGLAILGTPTAKAG